MSGKLVRITTYLFIYNLSLLLINFALLVMVTFIFPRGAVLSIFTLPHVCASVMGRNLIRIAILVC